MNKRLVIGISGASGISIAVELLKELRQIPDWESHLVFTKGSILTLNQETDMSIEELLSLSDFSHDLNDVGASIASGTFVTEGMVVVPCSMKTLSGIATGYSDNLLLRAADVTLKERRKLILVARETPLNSIHLQNMLTLSNMGAMVMPPMLTYYNLPKTVEDMTHHMVGKILNVFHISSSRFKRWEPTK